MWNIECENLVLEEILSEWEPFLFSSDVYWQAQIKGNNVPVSYKKIRISPGRLLISVKLLSDIEDEHSSLKKEVQENLTRFFTLTNQWKANWEKKILMELPIRTRQWQRIIQDLGHDRDYSSHQLANDVQIRLMLDLLVEQIGASEKAEFDQLLKIEDMKFKSLTFDNSFLWDENLSTYFTKDRFWYLYRSVSNPGGFK